MWVARVARQNAWAGSTCDGVPPKGVGRLHLRAIMAGKGREEFGGVLLLPNRVVRVHVNCRVNGLDETGARSGPPSTRGRGGGAVSSMAPIGQKFCCCRKYSFHRNILITHTISHNSYDPACVSHQTALIFGWLIKQTATPAGSPVPMGANPRPSDARRFRAPPPRRCAPPTGRRARRAVAARPAAPRPCRRRWRPRGCRPRPRGSPRGLVLFWLLHASGASASPPPLPTFFFLFLFLVFVGRARARRRCGGAAIGGRRVPPLAAAS